MKKLSMLCLVVLLIFSSISVNFAQNKDVKAIESFYKENGLKIVNDVPEGVIPLKVESLDELKEFVDTYNNELSSEYDNNKVEFETIQATPSELYQSDYSVLADYPTYYYKHTATVYNLSDVGGTIVSEVAYWVVGSYPPVFSIDYHDVYKSGISYNCNVIYDEKSATVSSDKSHIDVRVRGTIEVYIEFMGQLTLKTYRFDKQYTIGYVS